MDDFLEGVKQEMLQTFMGDLEIRTAGLVSRDKFLWVELVAPNVGTIHVRERKDDVDLIWSSGGAHDTLQMIKYQALLNWAFEIRKEILDMRGDMDE